MTQDETIEMARESGLETQDGFSESVFYFAKLVAEREREVVANWIMDKGFATGHGDCIVDLLDQLEWQIAEKEREACAKVCEDISITGILLDAISCNHTKNFCAHTIRARKN